MDRPETKPGWRIVSGKPSGNLVAVDSPQACEPPWVDWSWQSFAVDDEDGWPMLRYYNTITGEEYWEAAISNPDRAKPGGLAFVGDGIDEELRDASTGLPTVVGGNPPARQVIGAPAMFQVAQAQMASGGQISGGRQPLRYLSAAMMRMTRGR